ncbi:hypothetical protein BN1708_020268, partial [Verticillium longisporum]
SRSHRATHQTRPPTSPVRSQAVARQLLLQPEEQHLCGELAPQQVPCRGRPQAYQVVRQAQAHRL